MVIQDQGFHKKYLAWPVGDKDDLQSCTFQPIITFNNIMFFSQAHLPITTLIAPLPT